MKINGVPNWDTFQFMVEVIRELPKTIALGINRWVLSLHRGEEIEPGHLVCMGPHGWKRENQYPDWPCDEFVRVDRTIDEILNK